jgi:hypothetical protein
MKTHSDNTHEEREWMCYVYEENGKYELGNPSYGDESRIEVNPVTKAAQDATKGLTNKKYTIHGHPLKDGKIYTGRQYFSSTDILNEFIKTRDDNEYIVQWIVYPHQQLDTRTGEKVIHNRLRTLVFPDASVVTQAMQRSNPNVDVASITRESGQNSNASDGSLQNEAGVDWFAFQDALGEMGYMGIMDLEGPANGSREFKSEKMWGKNLSAVGIIAIALASLVYYNTRNTKLFGADIEVLDGVGDWHEN